jgi:hypothetical protein
LEGREIEVLHPLLVDKSLEKIFHHLGMGEE